MTYDVLVYQGKRELDNDPHLDVQRVQGIQRPFGRGDRVVVTESLATAAGAASPEQLVDVITAHYNTGRPNGQELFVSEPASEDDLKAIFGPSGQPPAEQQAPQGTPPAGTATDGQTDADEKRNASLTEQAKGRTRQAADHPTNPQATTTPAEGPAQTIAPAQG